MDLFKGLNQAQAEAVKQTSGPLLILAGAGSGKTKTLTHRIAYIISQKLASSEEILAVTFTNKAAKEMRNRLSLLLEQNNNRFFMPWMGTFHGICVRILRISGEAIGVSNNFVIYDEDDRLSLIKKIQKDLYINDSELKPKAVASIISSSKNNLIDSVEYEVSANAPYQKNIAKIYKRYQHELKDAHALDFDDLLIKVVDLFKQKPEIRKIWQDKFKYILIDEYQDTNAPQYNIVKLLVNDQNNICVVGDDWQSIYSWRGADFTNILNFERDFPGTKVVKLEQNYRSSGNILDAAGSVISKNKVRTDKKLWTDAGAGDPINISELYDEAEEANYVAEKIANKIASKAKRPSDFAVLYRTNAQSYILERAFMRYRIPYQIIGGVRFYDRKEIKDIAAYLKIIYQPNDIMSFSRIVNVPARGIGAKSIEKIFEYKTETNKNIIETLTSADEIKLTSKATESLIRLGRFLSGIGEILDITSPSELIKQILDFTNYRNYIDDGSDQAEDRLGNIEAMLIDAQNFVSLSDFLEEVALMSSVDSASDDEKVTLMTLHAAKGLEFNDVFIVGLEDGILPHARVYESGPEELEEERRLMYVGMTRAKKALDLTYARSRMQYGGRVYNNPSRFIGDIDDKVAKMSENKQPSFDNNIDDYSDVANDFMDFDIGDRVKSSIFGQGEIIDIDGLAATIRFQDGKTKKLNTQFARLEKLSE